MEKYHGFDKEFYSFLFDYLVTEGGLRWQIIVADLGTVYAKRSQRTSEQVRCQAQPQSFPQAVWQYIRGAETH